MKNIRRILSIFLLQVFVCSQFAVADIAQYSLAREGGENLAAGRLVPGLKFPNFQLIQAAEVQERVKNYSKDVLNPVLINRVLRDEDLTALEGMLSELLLKVSLRRMSNDRVLIMGQDGDDDHVVDVELIPEKESFKIQVHAKEKSMGLCIRNIVAKKIEVNGLSVLSPYQENSLPFGESEYQRPDPATMTPIVSMDIPDSKKLGEYELAADEYLKSAMSAKDAYGNNVSKLDFLLLNGGLGTRMKSRLPKGLVSITKGWMGRKDMNMLEIYLRHVMDLQMKYQVKFHVYIMNSFKTDDMTLKLIKDLGLDTRYIHVYSQGLVKRKFVASEDDLEAKFLSQKLNEKYDNYLEYERRYVALMKQYDKSWGDELPDEMGEESFNPPGHMDAQISAVLNGVVDHMKANGVEMINQSNIHHTVAIPRVLPKLLGQMLVDKEDVVLQTSVSSAAGGGLYEIDGTRYVLDNSLIDYFIQQASAELAALESTEENAAKRRKLEGDIAEYKKKKELANKAFLTSVANYIYKTESFFDKTTIEDDIKHVPFFEDTKTKEVWDADGELFNAILIQKERQTQGALLKQGKKLAYQKTDTEGISERKKPAEVEAVFRHDMLTALPALTSAKGFTTGLAKKWATDFNLAEGSAEELEELENQLQTYHNFWLALLFGANSKNRVLQLKLTDADMAGLLKVEGRDVQWKQLDMRLLSLLLMPKLINQSSSSGLEIVFKMPVGRSVQKAEQFKKDMIGLMSKLGLNEANDLDFKVLLTEQQVEGKGRDFLTIQGLENLQPNLVYDQLKNSIEDAELYSAVQDLEVTAGAFNDFKTLAVAAKLVRKLSIPRETANLGTGGLTDLEANEMIRTVADLKADKQLKRTPLLADQAGLDPLLKAALEDGALKGLIAEGTMVMQLPAMLGSSVALGEVSAGKVLYAHAGHATSAKGLAKGQKTMYLPKDLSLLNDFGVLKPMIAHESGHLKNAVTDKAEVESEKREQQLWPELGGSLGSYLGVLDAIDRDILASGTSKQMTIRVRDTFMAKTLAASEAFENGSIQLREEGLMLLMLARSGVIKLRIESKDIANESVQNLLEKWHLSENVIKKVEIVPIEAYSSEALSGNVELPILNDIADLKAQVAASFNDIASKLQVSA